jgi:VanZ family protein
MGGVAIGAEAFPKRTAPAPAQAGELVAPMTRASNRFDALARFASYLALALFALAAAAHVYVFHARPAEPFPLDGLIVPQTLQMFVPARTVFLRAWEADGLRALVTAASFALLVAVLGAFRLRRRR